MRDLISVGSARRTDVIMFWRYRVSSTMYSEGSDAALVTIHSYSAVLIKSSILLFTSSNILSDAFFFAPLNFSVAASVMGPVAEGEERASKRRDSSSAQAVSKCSRFVRICTIWPRYCDERRSTSDWQ